MAKLFIPDHSTFAPFGAEVIKSYGAGKFAEANPRPQAHELPRMDQNLGPVKVRLGLTVFILVVAIAAALLWLTSWIKYVVLAVLVFAFVSLISSFFMIGRPNKAFKQASDGQWLRMGAATVGELVHVGVNERKNTHVYAAPVLIEVGDKRVRATLKGVEMESPAEASQRGILISPDLEVAQVDERTNNGRTLVCFIDGHTDCFPVSRDVIEDHTDLVL